MNPITTPKNDVPRILLRQDSRTRAGLPSFSASAIGPDPQLPLLYRRCVAPPSYPLIVDFQSTALK